MPTFDAIQDHFQELIRKGLEGSVFVKRWETADTAITTLRDGTGLLAVPTGYEDVGYLTKDQGVAWTSETTTSDTTSLGAAEATRRDVTGVVKGLSFTMQESKRSVFELHEGIDLSDVEYDANGNLHWDAPDRPALIYYRTFVLFKDGDGVDAVYFGKWGPRMAVTDPGESSWNENDAVVYPVTMNAFNDSAVGTSMRTLWAAAPATLIKMGFTAAA